jgi:hypothetical protein
MQYEPPGGGNMFKLGGDGRDAAQAPGTPRQRGVHFDFPGWGDAVGAVETTATQWGEAAWATGNPPMEITQPMCDVEGDRAAIAMGRTQGDTAAIATGRT